MPDETPVVSTTITIDPHALSDAVWEELWNANNDDDLDLGPEIHRMAQPVEVTEEQAGQLAYVCRNRAKDLKDGDSEDKKQAIDLEEASEYLEGLLPEPEGNTNCLEGFVCPECKSLGNFKIAVVKTVEMSDNGEVDQSGDNEWEGSSRCECCECGHVATVADFNPEEGAAPEPPAEPGSIVQASQTLWVSALVPDVGADTYDGVRVCVFSTEKEAYDDLAQWLDDMDCDEDEEIDRSSIQSIQEELNASDAVESWKVEEQTLYS